ncbi:hypothetical protein DO97_07220 [Neosynechococcus sphagnicola sy1]|uniref:Uncharacterized protein n=1 Tax=Neosynechococcus sphagnicola sy1 TaxID=1497020 RepID=A0A098TP75_9CYAN|nr:hypothetical protein [Neosynechococcus sphagnicola]KGF72628.1 hypothetical protein DO97_07220 [Neosynechococcus sphagnicola sy1]
MHLPNGAKALATSLVATASCVFGGLIQPFIGAAIGAPHRGTDLIAKVLSDNPDFAAYQRGMLWLASAVAAAAIASLFFKNSPK